ncbi:HAMP domain-containing protein [Acidaminobacter sp. JC074]|uniref:HAMP domain-containing sensor histidine kinase n=1 Tax=Acidaminobacter sp. JC074 TaxID=2530199 RepID=UPI001F10AF14|nr:HAMP domain-containing sensor histidine kinase [Acidaminobacter sp. JC074]MCH4891279.1 HAMP domain-containing protein [Acidaminobacter sp. JC074]
MKINKIWIKFALPLGCLIMLALTFLSFSQFNSTKQRLISEFENEVDVYTDVITLGLSEGVWHYNDNAINELADAFFIDDDVAYIYVHDLNGTVLFERKEFGIAYESSHIIERKSFVRYGPNPIAEVRVGFTFYHKNEMLRRQLMNNIIITLIVMMATLVFVYYLSKRITKPLSILSKGLDAVAEQEFSEAIDVGTEDEIGLVANSFNHMRLSLEKAEQEANELTDRLEKMNHELEIKVDERTLELKEVNKALETSLSTIQETQAELIVRNDELEKTLITLKATEEELIYNAKRVLTSQLVAGVAHEINTPIGVTLTLSTFMESLLDKILKSFKNNTLTKSEFESFLDKVKESTRISTINLERAATLIEGFKKVAVDQVDEVKQTFNVKDYFDIVVQSIHPEYKKIQAEVKVYVDESLELYTYPGAITQILTNLMMNSIIHGLKDCQSPLMTIEVKVIDDQVRMIYTDNGSGIAEDIADKIFEPFFTTKRGRGGSGLGLFIIENIVSTTLNGSIKYHTDNGAVFTLVFPYEEMEGIYA